jgi:hypothetical protein
MTTAAERYMTARAARNKAEAECKEAAKEAFGELASEVFAAHKTLLAFAWSQYTPYFNDGDPCVFSANTDYPSVLCSTDKEGTQDEWSDWPEVYINEDGPLSESDQARKAVLDLLRRFEESDYKEMFGDHVAVIIRNDNSVTVEEYSHD